MHLIAQGAEAQLFKDDRTLIKRRISKGYRIPEIDIALRKQRTRKETKILGKISTLGCAPALVTSDDKETIIMGFIDGKTVRDCLTAQNFTEIMHALGATVAQLHNLGIIHGDLTTSNFIQSSADKKIYIIDFGLSFESSAAEHKAVDLHLLRQALESKHHLIWEKSFKEFLAAYKKTAKESDAILERLEKVERRGRYKKQF